MTVVAVQGALGAASMGLVSAQTRGNPNGVTVTFTAPVSENSATNAAHYTIDSGVVISDVVMIETTKVRLNTSLLAAGRAYTLSVSGVQDRSNPAEVIEPGSQLRFVVSQGVILRRVFEDLPGVLVSDLTDSVKFPHLPDGVTLLTSLEAPGDIRDNYGQQIEGLVTAPVAGEYTFHLCSDDQSVLYLSADENPANKQLIAREPEWNAPRQWTGTDRRPNRENISAPVRLEAGHRYYLEALMKEGGGGDHLAVAWRKPGDPEPMAGDPPIPGDFLSTLEPVTPVTIVQPPVNRVVDERGSVTFTVEVSGTPPYDYQWYRNGAAVVGASGPRYSLDELSPVDDGTVVAVQVGNGVSSLRSAEAVLRVVADTTAPRLLYAQSDPSLARVELTFDEPIQQADAEDLSHYSVPGVEIQTARLGKLGQEVVLSTSPQAEGLEYSLTVTGLRDRSTGANEILAGSQVKFFAWQNEEFIGPFASWSDVQRDFGARGDGVSDDTDPIQQALDNLGTPGIEGTGGRRATLFFPAGTYRITRSLRLFARDSVSMVGEHPETTLIRWDGPAGEDMLVADGTRNAKWTRFTWDGSARARTGVFHTQTPGGWGVTAIEHSDEVFQDMETGILSRPDPEFGQGDCITVLRSRFRRCSYAGVMTDHPMALEMMARHCVFEDCRIGTYSRAGSVHVYDSLFLRSTDADIIPPVLYPTYTGIRRNTSAGSRRFVDSPAEAVATQITIGENTIIDTLEADSIRILSRGPVMLVDNVIKSQGAITQGPVVTARDALLSVGNQFTVRDPVRCDGRVVRLDDALASADDLELTLPSLPPTLPWRNRTVFEVPPEADAATIQQIIDQAAQLIGQRPIVHFPQSSYRLARSLVVPPGADVQLVGDGYRHVSEFESGESLNGEPMLRLRGPVRATLRDLSFNDATRRSAAIVLEDVDQPGSRVYADQLLTTWTDVHVLVDRLDHTDVQLHRLQHYDVKEANVRVIGGPGRAAGAPTLGRTTLYSTASVANPEGYFFEVSNNGDLRLQESWYEGATPRFFKATGTGSFLFDGGRINTDNNFTTPPAVEVEDFSGEVTFLGTYFSRWTWWDTSYDGPILRIGEGTGNARVLVSGSQTGYGGFVANRSLDARFGSLLSQRHPSFTAIPDAGDNSPGFLRETLARSRDTQPRPLCPVPDGATDARFYRVYVYQAGIGLVLTRSNSIPVLPGLSPQSVIEHSRLEVNCAAEDADSPYNLHRYELVEGPADAVINATNGLFSWTPGAFTEGNSYPVTFRVSDDGDPPLSATQRFTVVVLYTNHPPVVLAPLPNQTASIGILYSLPMVVDAETNVVTWSLAEAPTGMAITPNTGLISWTPGPNTATGYHRITVRATEQQVPARLGEVGFEIRVLPEGLVGQAEFLASTYPKGMELGRDTLGPDWINGRGRIAEMTPPGLTTPYRVLMFDAPADVPCNLRSRGTSRDQEIDVWKIQGSTFLSDTYLRITESGTALRFNLDLSGSGQLHIDVVCGRLDQHVDPTGAFTLWQTNNLRALVPTLATPAEDRDFFTFGASGVDVYAKYQGVEFLRFTQYRHTQAGSAGIKLWGYDDGLRFARVRLKTDEPLFSDLAQHVFDLRDFGLRSVLVTGAIQRGSTELVLSASPVPPFEPGDWVIVETGGEPDGGRRGTVGVGGVWPSLRYPDTATRDTDTAQTPDTYCWIENDGSIFQWDGTAWRDRASFLSGTQTITNYYVAKAVPKALRARVAAVSENKRVLTLSEMAQSTASKANVHFDNAPVLNMTFSESEWVKTQFPLTFLLTVPEGDYAMGDPIWLINRPGCGLRGAGTNQTRLFSPRGTPSMSLFLSGCSNAVIESLHLQGNAGLEGFGFPFYHPRSGFWDGLTETEGNPVGRGCLEMVLCPGGQVRDVLMTDPLSDMCGGLVMTWSDSAHVERVAIYKRMPVLGAGRLVQLNWQNQVTIRDLLLDSEALTLGLVTWDIDTQGGVDLERVRGRNVTLNFGRKATIRDCRLQIDSLAQEGLDHWTPTWRAMLQFDLDQSLAQGVILEDIHLEQSGYVNRRGESLSGIACGPGAQFLRLAGGSYTSADYVPGGQDNGGTGLTSEAQTSWIEGFRVSGWPRNQNLHVRNGVVTNCWADYLRPEPTVLVVDCHPNRNGPPMLGERVVNPLAQLTNSTVLGTTSNPLEGGSTEIEGGSLRLRAGGVSAGTIDHGRFAWMPISGDFDVAVRVERLERLNNNTRAGIMVRREGTSGAPQVNVHVYGLTGVNTHVRRQTGQTAAGSWNQTTFEPPNTWLRLRKEGTRITTFAPAYYPSTPAVSAFGQLWQTNAVAVVPALGPTPEPLLLGLFATSEDNAAGQMTEAVFTDLVLNQSPTRAPIGVLEGGRIQIPFTAVDDDEPRQALRWSFETELPPGAEFNPATHVLSWTPSETQGPSTHEVTVKVTDDGTPPLSATNVLQIVVQEVNEAPVLIEPPERTVDEMTPLVLALSATDADVPANRLSYALVGAPAGMSIQGSSGVVTWTPTESQGPSTNIVTVLVSDDGVPSLSATNTVQIVVNEVNRAPTLPMSDQTTDELQPFTLRVVAEDADLPAQALTYSLMGGPEGLTVDAAGTVRWVPTEVQGPGTNTVEVTVTDTGSPALSATNRFQLHVSEVNSAPTMASVERLTATVGTTLDFTVRASDSDLPEQNLEFALGGGAPLGANLTSEGVFQWTPTLSQSPSTNLITVVVQDAGTPALSASVSFEVVVTVPAVVTIDAPEYERGVFTLKATLPEGVRYALEGSNDLETWVVLAESIGTGEAATLRDELAPSSRRYYRIRLVR